MLALSTLTWEIVGKVDVGGRPTRIALQPDGHYLWAACEETSGPSVVTAISVDDSREVKRFDVDDEAGDIAGLIG